MNIVQICKFKYPGQVEIGNISFRRPEDEILIDAWGIPDEPRPTEAEILAYGQQHERAIEINSLSLELAVTIQYLIDNTAKAKQFDSALSCVSYLNSAVAVWKSQAEVFASWRDQVWTYAYEQLAIYSGNEDPLPSVEVFMQSLPIINW